MAKVRQSFSRSAFWIAIEAIGGATFSSLGLLAIAALIGPKELGLAAIALAIIQTVQFFPDTLFHDAIIQRRRLTARHLGSAFWSVLVLSIFLTVAVVLLAVPAARLYGEEDLAPLLLALSGSCIPIGIASIQVARMRRAMRFRALAQFALVSRASGTALGLALALDHAGAWAMVAQYASVQVFQIALICTTTRWHFVRQFSLHHAKEISVFAFSRTASHFIESSRGRIFFALLGQYLSLQMLGQVNLAFRLVDSTTSMISTTITRLYLPRLSRDQDNVGLVATSLRDANGGTAALLMPLFVVLAFTSDDLVHLFASARWAGMEGLIPALCIGGIANVLAVPSTTALLAVGRPALVAITTASVLVAMLVGLITTAPSTGFEAVLCWSVPLLIGLPINLLVMRYAVGLGLRSQLASFMPAVLTTCSITAASLVVGNLLHSQSLRIKLSGEFSAAGGVYLLSLGVLILLFRQRSERLARVHILSRPSKEAL